MPDKERLIKLLVEYGIADKYIDDLCDEIEECFAPELEKARLYDKADILIKQFRESAPTDKHVIGLINAFIGIIEALAGKETR